MYLFNLCTWKYYHSRHDQTVQDNADAAREQDRNTRSNDEEATRRTRYITQDTIAHHINTHNFTEETKQKLADVTMERDILKKEKEEQLALLNDKLSTMEKSYESILQVEKPYDIITQISHKPRCSLVRLYYYEGERPLHLFTLGQNV